MGQFPYLRRRVIEHPNSNTICPFLVYRQIRKGLMYGRFIPCVDVMYFRVPLKVVFVVNHQKVKATVPMVTPPLSFPVSHCSTPHIVCAVPCTAVFCGESIECSPGMASKLSFKTFFFTLLVAPPFTDIIIYFLFHFCCISIHKLSYFRFFSASFCMIFLSAGVATSISVHVFSFLLLNTLRTGDADLRFYITTVQDG